MKAAELNEYECLEILISAGAHLNKKSLVGDTALFLAAGHGNHKCVKMLMKAGADVNTENDFHVTPLMKAAELNKYECLEILINAGADLNKIGQKKDTALLLATRGGHHKCVEMLIKAEADVNRVNRHGITAFASAVYSNNIQSVRLILKTNVKINVRKMPERNVLLCQHRAIGFLRGNHVVPLRDVLPLNDDVAMLAFVAGENIEGKKRMAELASKEIRLANICRRSIRTHLLSLDPHAHLFNRVPRLGLPDVLSSYLLYNISLDEDDDDD